MAGATGRKHQKGVAHHVPLGVRVDPQRKQAAEAAAAARGLSLAMYVDRLLEREAKQLERKAKQSDVQNRARLLQTEQEELPLKAG
jgi:hypothetical protein